jgi:streptogrisin B
MSKNFIKNIFLVIAFIFLLFMPNQAAYASEAVDVSVQESAYHAYESLMTLFTLQGGTEDKSYPDYYGGSYINDDGKLVVYVKNGQDNPSFSFKGVPEGTIIYKECDYSYSELVVIMDTINAYKFETPNSAVAVNFNSWGIYDGINRVIVRLEDFNEKAVFDFKTAVCGSDAIVFEQGFGEINLEVTLNPGTLITSSGYK